MLQNIEVTAAVPAVPVVDMIASSCVTTADLASLHRHLFDDVWLDRTGAEALFDLERAALSRCTAWTTFFVEAITDHVVWGERPTGRLDEGEARWLIAQVETVRTPASFAVLVNVIDEAQTVPSWFPGAVRAMAAGWPDLARSEDPFSRAIALAA